MSYYNVMILQTDKGEVGRWRAECLDAPDCVAYGDTEELAINACCELISERLAYPKEII